MSKRQSGNEIRISLIVAAVALIIFLVISKLTLNDSQENTSPAPLAETKTPPVSPTASREIQSNDKTAPAIISELEQETDLDSIGSGEKKTDDWNENDTSTDLPEDLKQQLASPPPELPEDLRLQLEGPPPELPEDIKRQLNSPPPELPEDIKRALETPPRTVSPEEVNNPN